MLRRAAGRVYLAAFTSLKSYLWKRPDWFWTDPGAELAGGKTFLGEVLKSALQGRTFSQPQSLEHEMSGRRGGLASYQ